MNDYALFAATSAVIVVAGSLLSRFADRISEETGLGRLLIGSVLLAGATSLPELTVGVSAVQSGLTDVGVGGIMGSSLINLMILGLMDLLPASHGRALRRVSLAHALPVALSIGLTSIACIGVITQGILPIRGISFATILICVTYLLGIRIIFQDQRLHEPDPEITLPIDNGRPRRGLAVPLAGFLACTAVILYVGPYLSQAAGGIAEQSGLGETFIGSTLVALSTSLPEVVACLAALRMGAPDLAIGNVFGSNAFNMCLLLPMELAHPGPLFAGVSMAHAVTGMAAIMVSSVVIAGLLYRVDRRHHLVEPSGILVIALCFAGLALVYFAPG